MKKNLKFFNFFQPYNLTHFPNKNFYYKTHVQQIPSKSNKRGSKIKFIYQRIFSSYLLLNVPLAKIHIEIFHP